MPMGKHPHPSDRPVEFAPEYVDHYGSYKEMVIVLSIYIEATARSFYRQQRREFPRLAKTWRPLVLERDEFRCCYCASTEHLVLDHVRALVEGGTNDLDNIQTLCQACNCKKSRRERWSDVAVREILEDLTWIFRDHDDE